MYKTKLPYDICRCATELCPERDTCLRWITIESDKRIKEPVRLSYSRDMCAVADQSAGQFDGVYKIEVEEIK